LRIAASLVTNTRGREEDEKHASAYQRLRRERSFPRVLGVLPKYKARLAEKAKAKKDKADKEGGK